MGVAVLLESAEIEYVVEEPGEAGGLGLDDLDELPAAGGIEVGVAFEEFREHPDRGQRRLQFVGDIGDEVGLLPRQEQLALEVVDDQPRADTHREQEHAHEQGDGELLGPDRGLRETWM